MTSLSSSESPPPTKPVTKIFVLVPTLTEAEKKLYAPPSGVNGVSKLGIGQKVDEIIGEHREGTDLYYFARYKEGIAYKVHIASLPRPDVH